MIGRNNRPGTRSLTYVALIAVAIFFVTVLIFFAGRLVWHSEERIEDPASLQAQDQNQARD